MITELFIAKRLRLNSDNESKQSSLSISIAMVSISIAITIMILSITIVCGFKHEIESKIYSLDSHIKIVNTAVGIDNTISTVNVDEVMPVINSYRNSNDLFASISLIAEHPTLIKTANDFQGIVFRGVDAKYNWDYLKNSLIEGNIPDINNKNDVVISQTIANKLGIKLGDSMYTYFIDKKIKTRKINIVGVFNTNLQDFDSNYIIGNISFIQNVNNWEENEGSYVGINIKDVKLVDALSYDLYAELANSTYQNKKDTLYGVTNTNSNNASFFSWLGLLDMNVIIIIILMAAVSAFTLISALLMIVLERIKMIGLLKTLGVTNSSIRNIFIYLTQKLILKSILLGNILGIGLSWLQSEFKIATLNPEAYYMPYVPIEFNIQGLIILNICILVLSYLTLLGPSYIISNIKPTTTLRFE